MTARESAIQSCEEWFGSPISNWDENQLLLVEIMQEAILAERAKCAKVASDLKKNAWDNMQLDDIDEHDKAAEEAIWAAAGYIHMAITEEVVAMETVEMIAEIIRKGGTF